MEPENTSSSEKEQVLKTDSGEKKKISVMPRKSVGELSTRSSDSKFAVNKEKEAAGSERKTSGLSSSALPITPERTSTRQRKICSKYADYSGVPVFSPSKRIRQSSDFVVGTHTQTSSSKGKKRARSDNEKSGENSHAGDLGIDMKNNEISEETVGDRESVVKGEGCDEDVVSTPVVDDSETKQVTSGEENQQTEDIAIMITLETTDDDQGNGFVIFKVMV